MRRRDRARAGAPRGGGFACGPVPGDAWRRVAVVLRRVCERRDHGRAVGLTSWRSPRLDWKADEPITGTSHALDTAGSAPTNVYGSGTVLNFA